MTARLEAADARQREFLADVAHELRTPVTAIEGFADRAGRRHGAQPTRTAPSRPSSSAPRPPGCATWCATSRSSPGSTSTPRCARSRSTWPRRRARPWRGWPRRPREGRHARAARGRAARPSADPAHVETILTNLITNAIAATPAGRVGAALTDAAEDGKAGIAVTRHRQRHRAGAPALHLRPPLPGAAGRDRDRRRLGPGPVHRAAPGHPARRAGDRGEPARRGVHLHPLAARARRRPAPPARIGSEPSP